MRIRFFFLWISLIPCSTFAKEIALTFDDAPREDTFLTGQKRAAMILDSLKNSGVQEVAFFANSSKLTEEGRKRLQLYVENFHLIGNHTHTHPELNKTDAIKYIEDIDQADRLLRLFPGFRRWFRYPYLREGETQGKRDQVRNHLKTIGYRNAYVTVNNYDWYMDLLYQRARKAGAAVDMEALKRTYVHVLVESVEYYDEMALQTLKRSPRHVLLLHENDLAAYFIGDLVLALRSRGWRIISPEAAYQDEIANYQTLQLFPANPGRIGEIAKDKGWSGQLWHQACDEQFLERLFKENGVYVSR